MAIRKNRWNKIHRQSQMRSDEGRGGAPPQTSQTDTPNASQQNPKLAQNPSRSDPRTQEQTKSKRVGRKKEGVRWVHEKNRKQKENNPNQINGQENKATLIRFGTTPAAKSPGT